MESSIFQMKEIEAALASEFKSAIDISPESAAQIAIDKYDSHLFIVLLQVLSSSPPSVQSMLTVYIISSHIELPLDFLALFIYNGIFEWKSKKDHEVARLVRFFCVFLRALHGQKLLQGPDLVGSIRDFIEKFSEFPEAKELLHVI